MTAEGTHGPYHHEGRMGSVTDLSLTMVSGPQRLPSVQEHQLNIGAHQVPRHIVKVCHLTKLAYPNTYTVFKQLFFLDKLL